MIEINTPSGWEDYGKSDLDSTVAYFEGGIRCAVPTDNEERGDEILVWRGVTEVREDENGEPYERQVFDVPRDKEVPDDASYLIEARASDVKKPKILFAKDIEDAEEKVLREAEILKN